MRDITQCHPNLQKLADELITACERKGLKIKITECFRTVAEQDVLYAQGRTKPGKKVTNARGSSFSSMHQWGVAFDICRNDGRGAFENVDGFFHKVGQIGIVLGLEWGGNWVSIKDMPHFQLPNWGSTPSQLKKLYGNPDRFRATWPPMVEVKQPILDPVTEKYGPKQDKKKFKIIKECYIRKTPGGDKVKFKILDEVTQTKCSPDGDGLARFKKGKKFDRIRKYTGSKGNTWYQTAKGYWLPAIMADGTKYVKGV